MNGEDWTTGIEYEAQSVDDPIWAAQTQQLAQRQRFWTSAGRVAVAVLLLEAALLLINAVIVQQNLSGMQSRPWFSTQAAWLVFNSSAIGLTYLGVGLLLGLLRVSPRLGVALAVAFPLFEIITSALVPHPGKPFPGSPLEATDLYPRLAWADLGPWIATPLFWLQLALVTLGVWAGIRLSARIHVARPLARA